VQVVDVAADAETVTARAENRTKHIAINVRRMLSPLLVGSRHAGDFQRWRQLGCKLRCFMDVFAGVFSVVEHLYNLTCSIELFDDFVSGVPLNHLAPTMCGYVVARRVEKEA
jgi:hypothetical protein